ncbi:MAG TPA: glycosyltransferase [Candidatus Binatia bacterium]|jgi:glycosyltransferase involved in cell wall biosynthesis|nr:glycosyltransferase [Candidatus Binatia bacterium]
MSRKQPTIGYIVSLFPCWSETFILNEIIALQERGVPVRIFSLKPSSEPLVHEAARRLLAEVIYPPPLWRLLLSLAHSVVRQPVCWLRLLSGPIWEASQGGGGSEVLKALYTLTVATHFAGVARRLGIDHFHAHWATYPALAVRIMRALTGKHYTLTTHAHDIFLANPYLRENLASAQTVVTISEYNRRYLISAGTPARKIKVVPCGINLQEFSVNGTHRRETGAIVTIGRLEHIKGFPYLVEACAVLKARGVPFTCDIIGEGSLRSVLEHKIAGSSLESAMRLRGALSQNQVRAALAGAQLFVLPSVQTQDGNQDGIPVALMEAMALGLPVISTPVSGIPELVIDGVSGLLVAPGDAVALADAIERLLTDPALREALSRQGREAVRARHDISRSVVQMQEVFREALVAAKALAALLPLQGLLSQLEYCL